MNDIAKVRRNNDFLVGLTVVVFTVLLVAAVLWLKQSELRGSSQTLVVRTRDVGGISPGNPVVIRGVRAGRVQSISLGESNWVVLTLGIDKDVSVPADPVVLIAASSLFGEWQATVTSLSGLPSDRELRTLIAEARTENDTLAGAVLPDIAQLTSVAGRIAGDVAQVAERVQVAFDDDAASELRESIRNVAKVSSDLSQMVTEQSRNIGRISTDVQKGITSVNQAAATVNLIASRIDSSTSKGELLQLVQNSRRAADELVQATTRLREIADDIGTTQKALAATIQRTDSIMHKINNGEGSLGLMLNDDRLYRNSDSLVMELRHLVQDVKSNPRKYFNIRIF